MGIKYIYIYIYIYIYEHTYRRLGGVLLTLYGYTHGVPIGFIPKVLLVAKGEEIYIYIYIMSTWIFNFEILVENY